MPFSMPLVRWQPGFILSCGLAVCGPLGAAPLFPETKEVPKGQVRIRVLVLSAAMEDAAQWMLEHDGKAGGLEALLARELEKHRAMEVVRSEVTTKPGRFAKEAPDRVKVIMQNDASHLWSAEEAARRTGEPLPDPAEVLEFDESRNIGPELEGEVKLATEEEPGGVSLTFTYTPPHEERPTTNWPLARGIKAPRVIVRPWTILTSCDMPAGQPMVLGAQMEAPHEGAVNTGRVWFALGQLDCGAGVVVAPKDDKWAGRRADQVGLTAWIFSVPNARIMPWLMARKGISGDAETLRAWLAATHEKGGPALSAVMHDGNACSFRNTMSSRRYWDDGTGFEPSREGPDIRAIPESDDEYELRHEMESEVIYGVTYQRHPSEPADPFAPGPPQPREPKAPLGFEAMMMLSLPPHAARWKRVESAMERDAATDPAAMELAAVGEERVTLSKLLVHGEVAVAGVWPHGERTRVAFIRCQRSQATQPVEPRGNSYPEGGTATIWSVDTGVPVWLPKLTGTAVMDDAGLAAEVLKGLTTGESELAAVFLHHLDPNARMEGASEPGEGYVENYLNTHVHSGGFPYNPRYFVRTGPGWKWTVDCHTANGTLGGVKVGLDLSGPTAPTVSRRWGVQLEHHTQHTPETSGVDLPVRFTHAMKTSHVVPWNKPTVLGVARHENHGGPRLRWTIAKCDAPPGAAPAALQAPAPPKDADPFEGNWMQVMLIAMKPGVAEDLQRGDEREGFAEKRWLAAIADGRAKVVELSASAVEPHAAVSMTTAKVTTFVEPREGDLEWEHPVIPDQPPPGTTFSSQIYLLRHVGGLELKLEPTELTLVHDGVYGEVTDVLVGHYEYPNVSNGMPEEVVVNVQRPVFTPHRSKTPWPPKELAAVIPWNGSPPPNLEKWFFLVRSMTPAPKP